VLSIAFLLLIILMPFIIIAFFYYYRMVTRITSNRRDTEGSQGGELGAVIVLALVSIFGYLVCYFSTYDVLLSFQRNSFGPSETAEVIASISGLTVGVGTSIAAIIKACALFLHARADVVRAHAEAENAAVMRDAVSSGKHELTSRSIARSSRSLRFRRPFT
jgi:cytochrome c oxidase assembly factor CtaG